MVNWARVGECSVFEHPDAWQQGVDFPNVVYEQVRSPLDKRFGLTKQMRRQSRKL
jgi:hypothetical protein